MANISIVSTSDFSQWHKYLQRLPIEQQDIYFMPEYYKLYEENGEGKAICFIFERNGEIALYPFLINEINKLGYDLNKKYYDIQGSYGYNGVISSTTNNEFVEDFYNNFEEYCKQNNIVAEFTRFHPLINNYEFSLRHLDIIFDRKTVYIDLYQNYDIIFKKFQKTTRKQIKRAINRYNIEVRYFENDLNQLDTFINIYYSTMDRVKSIQYLYFNKEFIKQLIEKTQNVIFVAYFENKPIGVIIAFYNKTYMHGHLGGALLEYLPMYPYSLLYTEMIKFGQTKGCRFLHVGGGATTNPEDSLLKYKMNFSDTTLDFYIGKKVYKKEIYDLIIKQWEQKYPEKKEMYKNFLLKYRY
jgi:lipid II:glycine glycyltransferase (peptidoglycan interpeptide bridge formation enzyme)